MVAIIGRGKRRLVWLPSSSPSGVETNKTDDLELETDAFGCVEGAETLHDSVDSRMSTNFDDLMAAFNPVNPPEASHTQEPNLERPVSRQI